MKKNIMLVDDNMINNFVMKMVINNVDEQLNVQEFTQPEKAINIVELVNPMVIFLDLNMPEMDGWQFLDKLTEKQLNYQVYILTSSTSETDRQRSNQYQNVLGFLNKPITEETISCILKVAS